MPARVPAARCRTVTLLLRSTARSRWPDSPERPLPGAGAASRGAGRWGAAALAALMLAAACSNSAPGDGLAALDTADDNAPGVQGDANVGAGASALDDPIVISAEPPSAPAWLDPSADPRTPQGRQRAQVLPLWVDDLDAAFPPDVCGSAWELDAVAVPASDVDIRHYGDVTDMAALGAMRYEHLVRSALAAPTHLAQLCVAVAAVDQARADALAELAPLIIAAEDDATGEHREAVGFPHEVTVVAASPSEALATACIPAAIGAVGQRSEPGAGADPDAETDPDTEAGGDQAQGATLRAYELLVSRGIEDEVVDVSYRVATVAQRQAADCNEALAWTAEWVQQAEAWTAEGQLWIVLDHAVSADALCDHSSGSEPSEPVECPHDWPPLSSGEHPRR